jgi:hypothetical protein
VSRAKEPFATNGSSYCAAFHPPDSETILGSPQTPWPAYPDRSRQVARSPHLEKRDTKNPRNLADKVPLKRSKRWSTISSSLLGAKGRGTNCPGKCRLDAGPPGFDKRIVILAAFELTLTRDDNPIKLFLEMATQPYSDRRVKIIL